MSKLSSLGMCILVLSMLVACESIGVVYEPYPQRPGTVPRPTEPAPTEPAPTEPAPPPTSTPSSKPSAPVLNEGVDIKDERSLVLFTVAGGVDRPEQLHYDNTVWNDGWAAYIQKYVQPEINRGFNRIVVLKACGMQPVPNDQEGSWNIVGQRKKTGNQVRSRALTLSQLEQHRPDLASTFVPAWSSVGAQVDELMLYIGLPSPNATQKEIEAWVEPFMSIPNVAFGLDSLGATESDAAGGRLLSYLMSKGKRVYVEPVMPKDEWSHWPRDSELFAATVIDERYDIMVKQDRWYSAEETGYQLVVLVQGRSGEDTDGRFKRIGGYLRAAPPNRVGVAFGTRGLTEIQVKSLIELGKH